MVALAFVAVIGILNQGDRQGGIDQDGKVDVDCLSVTAFLNCTVEFGQPLYFNMESNKTDMGATLSTNKCKGSPVLTCRGQRTAVAGEEEEADCEDSPAIDKVYDSKLEIDTKVVVVVDVVVVFKDCCFVLFFEFDDEAATVSSSTAFHTSCSKRRLDSYGINFVGGIATVCKLSNIRASLSSFVTCVLLSIKSCLNTFCHCSSNCNCTGRESATRLGPVQTSW